MLRDPVARARLRELARQIERIASKEPDRSRSNHLVKAVEFNALIGDADGARNALAGLRPSEVLGPFSIRLNRLIGPDEAHRM